MRKFKIPDQTYETEIIVIICPSKVMEKKFNWKDSEENTHGMFLSKMDRKKKETHYFIWLNSKKPSKRYHRVLSHELIHLVFQRFKDIGIPVNIKNDETFAYFYEALLAAALKKI